MSHQLYGTEECYHIIRQRCCDYIELERTYFGGFIADMTISHYLQNMRKDRTWGGNMELIAFAELYRKTIHIYRSGPQPDHIFGRGYSIAQNEDPIRLHFRGGNHYESLLPHNASEYFQVHEAGVIEENNLNIYQKLKVSESRLNDDIDSTMIF